ncbi:acetyltransferase [Pseudomonas vancouverensis]|uniref:Acetyltransferase n=1 Tax=Pseudomonas vancouverensis TaxID=95300 RepID=A0A4R4K8X8_PSEVA|nr:acetyltransferase [Pseudomonas vancouverensis]KAB0490638.1 acetyltransferase [Pseudomonas vancouverensis]TDB62901.1 acetyltransferase [Pseudomonas vancouverensis]
MSPVAGILILGFGGHARSVADVALASGITQLSFVDSNARPNEAFLSFPVKSALDFELPSDWVVFPAAGDNQKRLEQCDWATQQGLRLGTLISPYATVGVGAQVGEGSFIAHHAHIGPMAKVGRGCIINTGAIVEHECTVGQYTHVSVGAVIAGRSRIGECCFLGAGSTVIDGLQVADHVVLGAGACAHRNLEIAGTYVGVPAKMLGDKH